MSTWSQGAAPADAKFFTDRLSAALSNSIARSTTSSWSASASTCSASETLQTRTRATLIASETRRKGPVWRPVAVGRCAADVAESRRRVGQRRRRLFAMEDEHCLLSRQHAQANSESKLTDGEGHRKGSASKRRRTRRNKVHLRASPSPRWKWVQDAGAQADARRARRDPGAAGEGGGANPALCAVAGGGAHQVLAHQRIPTAAARAAHQLVPGDKRAVTHRHPSCDEHHAAVRVCRRGHQGLAQGN